MSTGRVLRSQTDEQLALAAQAGDERAVAELVDRFTGLAYTLARPFATRRSDSDDMRQEALIAITEAAHTYRPDRGAAFKSLAILAIRRQLYTVIVTDNRMMRRPTVAPFELDQVLETDDGDGAAGHDVIADPTVRDPADIISERDQLQTVVRVIRDEMSPLERESIVGFVFLDETYFETEARILDFDGDRPGRARYAKAKVVDNALTRARRKLRVALDLPEPRPLGAAA